jgi:stage II sporulation protein AA (anti-sigma F factor antagonist)
MDRGRKGADVTELDVVVEPVGNETVVLTVSGEVDLYTAVDLEEHLRAVLGNGHSQVILDLTSCEFFDSSGLNVLAQARRRLDGETTLCLVIPPDGITRQAFEIMRFELVFPIYPSRDDAIAVVSGI